MPRASRLVVLAGLTVIICLVLYASMLYTPERSPSSSLDKSKEAGTRVGGTGYFSWFPHGGFPEQHEAFRTAIRIAFETKRTIIAPKLRLGRSYDWAPFDTLSRRYEAQDKAILRQLCRSDKRYWQTILEPCETIDEWTEIPWSVLFDFTELQQKYGIQIIERTEGHGWGTAESALGGSVDPADVVVVDPMSFPKNGSLIDENAATAASSTLPLPRLMRTSQIQKIQQRLIQFGSLASAARYPTGESKGLSALNKDISSRLFILPDRLPPLTAAAEKITMTLGGRKAYNWLYLNLTYFNELDKLDPVPINEMSKQDSKDLMAGVITEIFGDMPINQAVAASIPEDDKARLTSILQNNKKKEMLATCIDYRSKTDNKYPMYYLVNELESDPLQSRPELFKPLFEALPCLFTKQDMYSIGVLDKSWAKHSDILSDPKVDYEALLSPMLDILVASKAYSFFETPQTLLSRFLNFVLRASQ